MIIQKTLKQENIVQLLIKSEQANTALKKEILEEIKRRNLSDEELKKANKEYVYFKNYIKKEASKPLPWMLKLACLIVPFSASRIYGNEDLPEREYERLSSGHNKRQREEMLKYSFIGIFIYAILAVIIMSISQVF